MRKEDVEDTIKQIITSVPVCLYSCEERLKYFLNFFMSEVSACKAKDDCVRDGARCDFEPMNCENMFDYITEVKPDTSSHVSDSVVFSSNMQQQMGGETQVCAKCRCGTTVLYLTTTRFGQSPCFTSTQTP